MAEDENLKHGAVFLDRFLELVHLPLKTLQAPELLDVNHMQFLLEDGKKRSEREPQVVLDTRAFGMVVRRLGRAQGRGHERLGRGPGAQDGIGAPKQEPVGFDPQKRIIEILAFPSRMDGLDAPHI